MTPTEAAALLTVCAAYDNRKPDADAAKAWALAMGDLRFEDCRDAVVEHYQKSREWIMPADVRGTVKKIRSERVSRHIANVSPPSGLSDQAYSDWYAAQVKAIGDGDYAPELPPPAAISGRDVLRELGQAGRSVDSALAVRDVRAAHAEAVRELQEAQAEAKRAKDERRAAQKARRDEMTTHTTPTLDPRADARAALQEDA